MWIAELLLACNGDDKPPDGSPTDDPACVPTVSFVEGPSVRGSDPLFPLSRAVTVTLSEAAELDVTATDVIGRSVRWVSPSAIGHDLPLVGLQAGTTWTLDVTAVQADGCTVDAEPVEVTTDPLPAPFPTIDVISSVPESMEPGLTIVPIYTKDISYIAVLNHEGAVVWLYGPTPEKFTEIGQLASGHLLALDDLEILELDWMGVVRAWTAELSTRTDGIPLPFPEFHHDVLWTSDDKIVVLTKEPLAVDAFPSDYSDPTVRTSETVANDLIVKFEPETGEILGQWEVTAMLDLERLGWESLNIGESGFEWAHCNAVTEDVANNRWILSTRNQDALLAYDIATSQVDWILANPDNWHAAFTDLLLTPGPAPFEWPYHQHAVKYDAATSRVMVFDNGNYRSSPWTGVPAMAEDQSYSRVVEYTVDETARTVVQNWDFRLDPVLFSFAMGDADWLPNGNVLGDFAYVEYEGGQEMEDLGRGNNSVRLVEFAPLTGAIVWELDIWGALSEPINAWQAYRVQRIPWPNAPPTR